MLLERTTMINTQAVINRHTDTKKCVKCGQDIPKSYESDVCLACEFEGDDDDAN